MKRELIKVAIIDMNNGRPNQGLRGIQEILCQFDAAHPVQLSTTVFDLRQKGEIPDTSFDIYISTGGPGDPHEGLGEKWENDFFDLLDAIEAFNQNHVTQKKFTFLICHSFQMACRKYNLGVVNRRKSTSFGILPVHLTQSGDLEPTFFGLNNPFFAVDSRDWQVVEPNDNAFTEVGATILAIEKYRPNIDLERCIMAIRFSDEMIGTQFHPEADPVGMKMYLLQEDKKTSIIEQHGEAKYFDMLNSVDDSDKIILTQAVILPNFLKHAIRVLENV